MGNAHRQPRGIGREKAARVILEKRPDPERGQGVQANRLIMLQGQNLHMHMAVVLAEDVRPAAVDGRPAVAGQGNGLAGRDPAGETAQGALQVAQQHAKGGVAGMKANR